MSQNKVFIATSIDGFIADKEGGIDWLHSIPNPEGDDMGYASFMNEIDALVMGRNTFETVCSFDIDWPYSKPVFVLSNSLSDIPDKYEGKAFLVKGTLTEILDEIHSKGYDHLYIDGGSTIQNFLKEELIDTLIITQIPILLGGGISLFGELPSSQKFKCVETKHFLGSVSQSRFEKVAEL
ncbi:dihydrofolate reductase family protein [Crocinitomicaceae bacterium]|nr:dihydrofolate reductase family protein [Crocinitomicaceae bacterium]